MNPDFSHVRVTVVDLMGVFLPGTIWALLLVTLDEVVKVPASRNTPVDITLYLFTEVAPKVGVGFYVVGAIIALIVGYVAKYVAIRLAEPISTVLDAPIARLSGRLKRETKLTCKASDHRFPYDVLHRRTDYYGVLAGILEFRLGIPRTSIPTGQFFGTCKRLLKLHAPALWEEAEQREADVRMLASLVLAGLFSLSLAVLQAILGGAVSYAWLSTSIASSLFLCFAYRARRRREVESVYFATLAALPLIEALRRGGESQAKEVYSKTPLNRSAGAAGDG